MDMMNHEWHVEMWGWGEIMLSLVLSLARARDVEESAEHWSMHVKVAI